MMKAISSKRAKTDADFEEMARIEWYASLYLDKSRICIPSEVLEAAFVGGAKKMKLGKQAQAGLFVKDTALLEFDGCDLTVDQIWERDQNRYTVGVRISTNKVMRTRFRVDDWKTAIEVIYDDGLFNAPQISDILRVTGEQIGVGDWRPKFGRFAIVKL